MKTALSLADWIDYAPMDGNYRQRPAVSDARAVIKECIQL
jgi:hypothetical protein